MVALAAPKRKRESSYLELKRLANARFPLLILLFGVLWLSIAFLEKFEVSVGCAFAVKIRRADTVVVDDSPIIVVLDS
jgi:hypothetical protein